MERHQRSSSSSTGSFIFSKITRRDNWPELRIFINDRILKDEKNIFL